MIAGRPKKTTETGRPSYDTTSLNARTGGGGVVVWARTRGGCFILIYMFTKPFKP